MRRFVILFVVVPVTFVIVALSVANRAPVTFSFDPISQTPLWSVTMPLYLLLFAVFALGALAGGFAAWRRQSGWRRMAREQKAEAADLRRELERLRNKAPAPATRPVGSSLSLPATGTGTTPDTRNAA